MLQWVAKIARYIRQALWGRRKEIRTYVWVFRTFVQIDMFYITQIPMELWVCFVIYGAAVNNIRMTFSLWNAGVSATYYTRLLMFYYMCGRVQVAIIQIKETWRKTRIKQLAAIFLSQHTLHSILEDTYKISIYIYSLWVKTFYKKK